MGTLKNPIQLHPDGVDIGFDMAVGYLSAPRDAFNVIVQQTGASPDPSAPWIQLVKNCNTTFEAFDVTFILGDKRLIIPSKNYIVPYDKAGSDSRTCFLNMIPIDQTYWIMGTPFLLQYYSVFDAENGRVGFGDPPSKFYWISG